MISVIDTSVLITFYQLKSVHLLNSLFNEVYVPITVEEQFLKKETNPRLKFLFEFRESNIWFKKCQTYHSDIIELLRTNSKIDEGEREAIAQYKKIQEDLSLEEGRIVCIIDENDARNIALKMDIRINGTLYLLAKLDLLGLVDYRKTVSALKKERRYSEKAIILAYNKVKEEFNIN